MSPSGEFNEGTGPHPTIGTSTPVTVGLFALAASAIFLAGGAWWRLGSVADHQADQDRAISAQRDQSTNTNEHTELRLQRLEDHWTDLDHRLDTFDAKLDRLFGGTVEPAKARAR